MACTIVGRSRPAFANQFQETCPLVSDWRTARYLLAGGQAHTVQGLQRILLINCRKQAMSQACAFPSPFLSMMSVIRIYRQPSKRGWHNSFGSTTEIKGKRDRPVSFVQ